MVNLAQQLSYVYWIGGSPCAGKTSIARMLVNEYGFTYYKSDDLYDEHLLKNNWEQHPNMSRLKVLSWTQYWSRRFCSVPVEQQVQESIALY
ncbi:nucleoside/nucleotide kinase family protein [Planococcus lenghuensis]|uniref:Uncharacterized protein n=1 Tax=Planococcus lenghuensis TaxID=2213202 RepID=A0A1Q2KZ10_9BACL|nr:hypothetical protein [Planococcus lenghuensis]AQQ53364.1 hypothetical protein B0X71_09940 [Planococcus lenghuensis]